MGNTAISKIKNGGTRARLKRKIFGTLKNVMIFTPIHINIYTFIILETLPSIPVYMQKILTFLNYKANDVQQIIGILTLTTITLMSRFLAYFPILIK